MKLSALHACVLVQSHEGVGDDETFQNHNAQAVSYLLLVEDRLYRVAPDGKIQMARIPSWTDLEVI